MRSERGSYRFAGIRVPWSSGIGFLMQSAEGDGMHVLIEEEIEYIASCFNERLGKWKGARIALHGTRDYARAIIERFDGEYSFCAVVSDDFERGAEFAGKRIVSEQDALKLQLDVIIMTERVQYAEEVYQRLSDICRCEGIGLFDMYGLDWLSIRPEIDRHEWLGIGGWLKATEPYDVVSFEVPDCLIMSSSDPQADGRANQIRPMFKHLIDLSLKRGKEIIYIGHGPQPHDQQVRVLVDNGFVNQESADERFFMRAGEDGCWHRIVQKFSGKAILHIGYGIGKECILPRYYGVDTYRMTYDFGRGAGVLLQHPEEGAELRFASAGAELRLQLEQALEQCDVVSFDVFDTILMRRALSPEDVFEMVEQKALRRGIPASGYRELRIEVQNTAGNADLSAFYGVVGEQLGLSSEQRDCLMEMELETERAVITRRESICEYFEKAKALGRRVVLVTDMYLRHEDLVSLLVENGIEGYDELVISCEKGRMKREGLLELLLSQGDDARRIVHIGDSWHNDILPAESLGMRWVYVRSAGKTARDCGYGYFFDLANSLPERLLLGECFSEAFQNPFEPFPHEGAPLSVRLRYFAWLFMTPLVSGFLTWLLEQVEGAAFDGVLFAARDGWMPFKVYEDLKESHADWEGLPRPIYFYTNRRAAFIPCSDKARSMADMVSKFEFSSTRSRPEHMMSSFFGLVPEVVKGYEESMGYAEYIDAHRSAIKEEARRYRSHYMEYLDRTLGDDVSGRFAFVDFVGLGTCQHYLGEWVPFQMEGFYFGSREDDSDIRPNFETYLPSGLEHVIEDYMLSERFMTSPEASLEGFREDGSPLFSEEVRNADLLESIAAVQKIVLDGAMWFFRMFDWMPETITPALIELLKDAGGSFGLDGEDYDDWGRYRI